MSKNKFVSATKPKEYADQLHLVQCKIKKLAAELKELESTEKGLKTFLLKYSNDESFLFASADGFQKKLTVGNHSRLILDQEEVLKMLKKRTPYKTASWISANVDWVYT